MKKILKVTGILFTLAFLFFLVYVYDSHTTPILMYHSFDKSRVENYAAVDPGKFYKQMQFIKKNGYCVVSLDNYCRMLSEDAAIPRKIVIITIDDGYKDNLEAIKILKEFDYPATIFLIWDRIDKPGYLSAQDINDFLKNTRVKIGSHSLSHPDLPKNSNEQLKEEIFVSKDRLEKLFSAKIETFASPTGAFDERILKDLKDAGYLCACTTNRGFSKKINRFALRRIKVTNRDSDFTFWAKISGFYNVFKRPKKPY